MKVINLAAGPGAGKSTTAADLFATLKKEGAKVELVTEVAKDYVYDNRDFVLQNQLYILAKQDARLRRLRGQVDIAITDSPIFLAGVYARPPFDEPWFQTAVEKTFRSYDNATFFIHRTKPYQAYGRTQTEEEARALDKVILRATAKATDGDYQVILGDNFAAAEILRRMGL